MLGSDRRPGAQHGRREGVLDDRSGLLPLQQRQPGIGLPSEIRVVLGVDEQVHPLKDVAPHRLDLRLVARGFGAHGVRRRQIHDELRTGEDQCDREQRNRDSQGAKAPPHGDAREPLVDGHPCRARGRGHGGKDVGKHQVNEEIGEQNAQRGEEADLPEHAKAGQAQRKKRTDVDDGRQRTDGKDLVRGAMACRLGLAIDEQQIHRALVDGDGDQRPAESEGQRRDVGFHETVGPKRQTPAHQRGQESEDAQPRTRETSQQQQGDADGRHQHGQICIPRDEGFVVDGRAVAAHRSDHDALARLPGFRPIEALGQGPDGVVDGVGGARVARDFARNRGNEKILSVLIEDVSALDAPLLAGHQIRKPRQHDFAKAKRILRHPCRRADTRKIRGLGGQVAQAL